MNFDELSLRRKVAWLTSRVAQLPEGAQRDQAAKALAQLHALTKSNPLEFFEPYPKQESFLRSREFLKAFFGGNGAGKTVIGVVDDLIQLCDEDAIPAHLLQYKRWQPPFFLRVVAPKNDVIESTLLEKFREFCPPDQLLGGSVDKAYNKQTRKLRFNNGSWVLFNTSEQDRDAHAGVELHRVHFDEEPPGEHGRHLYTENIARLRRFIPDAQIMFTMTPLFGLSWTFDEVWERREEDGVFCTVASMLDNPFINAAEMVKALKGLSEEERAAVIEGKFIHFHGRVLNRFRDELAPEGHLVPRPSPEHVRLQDVLVGIDPGIRQAAVVWVAFDRDNHAVVFDELYPRDCDVPTIAKLIHEKNQLWGLDHPTYVMDPSGRNRVMTNAESVQGEFNRAGIYPNPGQNDRLAGVLQWRARVEAGAFLVSEECVSLRNEIKRWVVARDEDTERDTAKAKGAGGSFATKGPDHIADATRYCLMERLWMIPEHPRARGYGDKWKPNTAPPSSWFVGRSPVETGPMGSMS